MKHNKSVKIKRSKNRLYKKKKSSAKVAVQTILFVLLAGGLVFVGYSAAGPIISLISGETESEITTWTPTTAATSSNENMTDQNNETTATEEINTTKEESAETGAYMMPESALESPAALSSTLNTIKELGFKSVLVPMKNTEGNLLYKSDLDYIKDTDLVIGTIPAGLIASTIRGNGLVPYAYMPALKDNAAPTYVEEAGFRFSDDTYFWLDAAAANGGKRWLDPFLSGTRKYFSDLSAEIMKAGFEEVILSEVRFPNMADYDKQFLHERNFTADRCSALTEFYDQVYNASGKKAAVAIDIKDVLAGWGQSFSATSEILTDKSFTGTIYLMIRPSDFDTQLETGENRFIGLPSDNVQKTEVLVSKASEYIGTNVTVAVVVLPDGLTGEELKACYAKLAAE